MRAHPKSMHVSDGSKGVGSYVTVYTSEYDKEEAHAMLQHVQSRLAPQAASGHLCGDEACRRACTSELKHAVVIGPLPSTSGHSSCWQAAFLLPSFSIRTSGAS
jgi:hypothetical protein